MPVFFSFVDRTSEEAAQVQNLQHRVSEAKLAFKFTDTACLRFLRGRLGNEDEAFEYMKNHGRWRVELGVDNLGPGDAQAKGKVKRFGRDRSGRPIVVILARRHLKKNCDLEEIRRNFIYELEGLIKDCDPVQEQLTIIFDLTQFGMKNMDYDLVKLLLDVLEYNYPEILGQSYIVNSPTFFKACWSIIKRWVSDLTASKVIFTTRKKLSECIDEDQIETSVGVKESGIKNEPDEEDAAMEAAAQGEGVSPLPSPPPGPILPKGEHHNKDKCEVCMVVFSKTFGIISGRSHCRMCMKSLCKAHIVMSSSLKEKVCQACDQAVNEPKPPATPAVTSTSDAVFAAALEVDIEIDATATAESSETDTAAAVDASADAVAALKV